MSKTELGSPPVSPEAGELGDLSDERALLYDILTRTGLEGRDAYLLIQLVEEMASANLIHRFEGKLEAQTRLFENKFEAQNNLFASRFETQNSLFAGRFEAQNSLFAGRFEAQHKFFESRFEAQHKFFESKFDAVASKFNLMLWFIGVGVSILIAVNLIVSL